MELTAYVTTANDIGYSPRKIHIIDIDGDGRTLCGCELLGIPTVDATKEWVNQPDYYRELCQRCKKIANKLLEREEAKQ